MQGSHHKKGRHLGSVLDITIYIAAFVGPLTAAPQAYTIWTEQSAKDVSLLSSFGYLVLAILWLMYGSNIKKELLF